MAFANGWSWQLDKRIPSQTPAAEPVIEDLVRALDQAGWPQRDVFGVHLAVEEALVNAIKHGNRESAEKTVRVQCGVAAERVWIEITDQGPGFNPGDVPDPTRGERLEMPHGRGLLLMRTFMSRVEHLGAGNIVVLEKVRAEVVAAAS